MRYGLTPLNPQPDDRAPGAHYNEAPLGWEPITAEEFARSAFFLYSVQYIETRSIYRTADKTPVEGGHIAARLFFLNEDEGFAMASREGSVCYYRFGCRHQWRGLSEEECRRRNIIHHGRSYQVKECGLCGKTQSTDSSD